MRDVVSFNKNWKFVKNADSFIQATTAPGESVNLPHTWNYKDGYSGIGDYYRGLCYYVKKFAKPKGEKFFIEFKGANASADVYLNGTKLGHHDGGYSAFKFEMTDYLKDENVLVIGVSNEKNDKVYPQEADFTFYGGLYRDVNLITLPSSHFDIVTFGGQGVKLDATVKNKDGILKTFAYVIGEGKVITKIYNAENKIINESRDNKDIIIHPAHLWNGINDPYLYKVEVSLIDKENNILDQVTEYIGFRTFFVDPDEGFFLNGKSYPLRGVARHQDKMGIGNALSKEDHETDIKMILDLGANTIRLAHYQHDDYFYHLADKYGLVIWSEIPYISRHLDTANTNAISQMEELIMQTYNHPSIVFRGISNEITMKRAPKSRYELHRKLNNYIHKNDPNRLTTLASYMAITDGNRLNFLTDVFSLNLYYGWYIPGTFLNSIRFSIFHFFFPKRPVGLSEYGAEGMPNIHSEHPRRFDNSEEYQAIYHEKMLKIIGKRPYIWGTHVWNMFDFGANARNQGGDPGKNHKGLVTFDREIKKDAFYIYKAYWSKEPFIHICSKRFVNRAGNKTIVKVYSNQKKVTLYVNNQEFKSLTADKVFRFRIPLKEDVKLTAKTDNLEDTSFIKKVSSKDRSYICTKSNSYSWEKKQ